ncbi:MAG: DUF59 domain-containing protein [Planctomycetota bacterium]|nr:MAG: DUF59 domain-containing protein [Planctomycetota bacterium]
MATKEEIMEALKNVYDPEIMINIVDLGLVYDVEVDEENKTVTVKYSLTAPGCPLSHIIDAEIQKYAAQVEGIEHVETELVWEPMWNPSMMSDEAKLTLGYDV